MLMLVLFLLYTAHYNLLGSIGSRSLKRDIKPFICRVSTGQGKMEKVRKFEWSGKVRERLGKNIIFEKSEKTWGK